MLIYAIFGPFWRFLGLSEKTAPTIFLKFGIKLRATKGSNVTEPFFLKNTQISEKMHEDMAFLAKNLHLLITSEQNLP